MITIVACDERASAELFRGAVLFWITEKNIPKFDTSQIFQIILRLKCNLNRPEISKNIPQETRAMHAIFVYFPEPSQSMANNGR